MFQGDTIVLALVFDIAHSDLVREPDSSQSDVILFTAFLLDFFFDVFY